MPQKDPEKRREYMRQYKARNREKMRDNQKRYQERTKDARKEYGQRYYQENRERILQREAERYRSSADVRAVKSERAKRWAEDNPEEVRKRARKHWAKKKYGLTLAEYEAIMERGCAICGMKEDPDRSDRRNGRLCMDHDHTSGQIRDALCNGCNTGLGSFADNPARLRDAADYLERHA